MEAVSEESAGGRDTVDEVGLAGRFAVRVSMLSDLL